MWLSFYWVWISIRFRSLKELLDLVVIPYSIYKGQSIYIIHPILNSLFVISDSCRWRTVRSSSIEFWNLIVIKILPYLSMIATDFGGFLFVWHLESFFSLSIVACFGKLIFLTGWMRIWPRQIRIIEQKWSKPPLTRSCDFLLESLTIIHPFIPLI